MRRPTRITWDQLRVGALIVVGLAILSAAIVTVGRQTGLFAARYKLVAFLPSASGLVTGGQVTIAGQLAGVIDEIEFLPPDADTLRNLRIVVAVSRNLSEQVRGDSRARIRTLGLLGDRIFDITPGTPAFPPLQEGDTIPVTPAADYEQLIMQASQAMDDIVVLTRDLREISTSIVQGQGTVGQLVTNRALYDQFTVTLSRTSAMLARMQNPESTFGRLIDDPTLYRNAVTMLASLDTVLVQLASTDGTLGRLMRDDSLYVHLVGSVQGANALLRQLNTGDGTAARLITDPRLYDELVKAVSDLNAILEDVRRDPQRYTRGLIRLF